MENKYKNKIPKKNIFRQMFDVRPVNNDGSLNVEKMSAKQSEREKFSDNIQPIEIPETVAYHFGVAMRSDDLPMVYAEDAARIKANKENIFRYKKTFTRKKSPERRRFEAQIFKDRLKFHFAWKKYFLSPRTIAMWVAVMMIFGMAFYYKGMSVKKMAMQNGQAGYLNLAHAKDDMLSGDIKNSKINFAEAYDDFDSISKELSLMSGSFANIIKFVPVLSKVSSGAALAQAGKDISQAGIELTDIMNTLDSLKNQSGNILNSGNQSVSMLKIFQDTNANIKNIQELLQDASDNIDRVNVNDLPSEQQAKFAQMKSKLPEINSFLATLLDNSQVFTDVLGGNGPRKYLFLFQNNQEMRATGGFIGTYGVMNILNGRIEKFFIDGIFNPDGQLKEKVVPPFPIQKISANWSLHDSNWFPNFPTSAEKATWFYEKTGGPTVDGVIAMTPIVMQKLLKITGPIDMPEYGVIIDENNFLQEIQQEVEVDYDKETNQPKKILADLAPKILDKIFNTKNVSDIAKTAGIMMESLSEKQILIYSTNYDIEKKISELHWSGEILPTQKDYLSVINTNINGYKTDGVIDEKVEHNAQIQDDGSIIDTVIITRHHNGGSTQYDWLNKVNADYMRVYVPKGSQLLSAEGQTREFDTPPLDYDALGFRRDPQVKMEEDSIKIDHDSGTRIYDDGDKTVFANWTYVSPQETLVITYKYLLPFRMDINSTDKTVDTYSLLAQKQSGSIGDQLVCEIDYPQNYTVNWQYPDEAENDNRKLILKTDLKTDKFLGIAFSKK